MKTLQYFKCQSKYRLGIREVNPITFTTQLKRSNEYFNVRKNDEDKRETLSKIKENWVKRINLLF